jgi:hypothetical protein
MVSSLAIEKRKISQDVGNRQHYLIEEHHAKTSHRLSCDNDDWTLQLATYPTFIFIYLN